MPIGCYSLIPYVADALVKRQPNTVLDLGMGMGFYGAVVRQWLDYGVQPRRTVLDGVEGFEGYSNPCWDLYDAIHVCTIHEFLATYPLWKWDAILLLDVLEHFDRDVGSALLMELRAKLHHGGILMVGTPAVYMEQGAAHGNELERHRSLWTAEDLSAAGLAIILDGSPDAWGNQMAMGVATA